MISQPVSAQTLPFHELEGGPQRIRPCTPTCR
jgi:hypothetical protein